MALGKSREVSWLVTALSVFAASLSIGCAHGVNSNPPPPEQPPGPCNGSGLPGDSCPPPDGKPVPNGCTTPKLSLNGQPFLSNNLALTEDAEIAAIATHVDPVNGGVPQEFVATTEAFLHLDPATGRNCIVRKRDRAWMSPNVGSTKQGDWKEISPPDKFPNDWISDPGLAVDSAGFVYMTAARADVEQDCTTNNAINHEDASRVWVFVAPPGGSFGDPFVVDTETNGTDHPEIAANPKIPGQIVITYLHTHTGDTESDKLVTLQRQGNTTNLVQVSRCSIEPAGCSLTDTAKGNSFAFARPAFSDAGDLFVAFNRNGTKSIGLQRLSWDPAQHWNTGAASFIGTPDLLDGTTRVNFHATLNSVPVDLAADPTPGLAVGNIAANTHPVVYVSFESDPVAGGFADDRKVNLAAVDGTTDLTPANWKGPIVIDKAFHSSISMAGASNALDLIFMQAMVIPTTSVNTPIQTFVQRFDASRMTAVGAPVAVSPTPPTLNDLTARHGEGGGFTTSSLYIGEYEGIASLGADGFVAATPSLAKASNDPGNTVQAALSFGSQKCDPPTAVAINRPDSFWQCDNCNCGADGVQNQVGCIPGSVSDPATICKTLCGGTVCGRALSCAHAACSAPASGASATVISANSCNTALGPFPGSEPSDFAEFVAADNGTSSVRLASAGNAFQTASPGTVSFNLSESPPRAGSEIEISRINLSPNDLNTPEIDLVIGICPLCITITLEPSHSVHDVHMTHGQRVYGVFSDATHFQVPVGAADFFAAGFDDATPVQQFQSNSAPVAGSFDPSAGTFSLDLTIGDPDQDGAEAKFNGTITKHPAYNCAAGIPPVFAPVPLATLTLSPCFEGAPIAIPLPTVSDLCTPNEISVSGAVISIDGVTLASPIPIQKGIATIPSGVAVIRWTATDGNGTTTTTLQTVNVRGRPVVYATSQLEVDDFVQILTPGGFGSVTNTGTGQLKVNSRAVVGNVLSRGPVFLGDHATIHGSVRALGAIMPQNGVTITGQSVSGVLPAFAAAPTVNTTFPATNSGDVNLEPGQTAAIAPGSYRNVNIKTGAKLSLETGKYFFVTLDLEPQASLRLDQEGGLASVSVSSNLIYRGAVTDPDGVVTNIDLTYLGTNAASIESPFLGVLRAPNAKITLATLAAGHAGEFFAKDIEVSPNTKITARPFTCILP